MLISLHHLPRLHNAVTRLIDLRQTVILGPLQHNSPYPTTVPITADLRPSLPGWTGGLLLGGSTERLYRQMGDNLKLAKLCVYHASTPSWLEGDANGPEIVEYLSIVDPHDYHLIYKCRRRRGAVQVSYVMPEQIDRFASRLSQHAWFQTPAFAALTGQCGHVDEVRERAVDDLLTYLDETIIAGNLLTVDHYDAHAVVETIGGLLTDLDVLVRTTDPHLPQDVATHWIDQFAPSFPKWDVFLQEILTGKPLAQTYFLQQLGPHALDLAPPPPLDGMAEKNIYPIPQAYLPVAETLERSGFTDFAAHAIFGPRGMSPVVLDWVIDRFAPIWGRQTNYDNDRLVHRAFNQVLQIYTTLAPHIATSLVELRIVKTFNEEATIEFLHHDTRHDHVMHIDFALLSYCSVGLGRFFHSPADQPA